MNPLEFLNQQAKQYKRGFKKADIAQTRMARQGLGYGESVLDPRFKEAIAAKGVSARETPAQFLGAYSSRMLIDVANDGTRTYWWRWNHPLAIAQRVTELGVQGIDTPTGRAVAALGVAIPAVAAAGTFDITNPEEYGRPKGFAHGEQLQYSAEHLHPILPHCGSYPLVRLESTHKGLDVVSVPKALTVYLSVGQGNGLTE